MYFYLDKPKAENSVIYLIHYLKSEGKNFKYSTGQKISPEDWDFENRMPKTYRGSKGVKFRHLTVILQQYARLLEDEIKQAEIDRRPLTRSILKKAFDRNFKGIKEKDLSFIEAVQDFIDSKNASGGQSDSWNQKYSNLKAKLELFEKHLKRPIYFEDIDEAWIDQYSGFLRNLKTKPFKPHNDNTLHRNINFLFTFLIWAKGKHHDLDLDQIKNPVKKYQADDVHLTLQEVEAIEKLELKPTLDRVRDMFLIGVYSGQRFSDYSVFEKADLQGQIIVKRAEKTENESYIPLHDKLKALLDKYNWKLPKISSQKFNPHIQKICKLAGIDTKVKETVYRGNEKEVNYLPKYEAVTSHTARRTFITLAAEQGMADHLIMKITGIRDPKTLLKYKKTSDRSVIEAMNKFWG